MIKTCQHCGAVNGESAESCCSCDTPLGHTARSGVSHRVITRAEGNLAVEPEWRREVSKRFHAYRVRRHGETAAESQAALPFEPVSSASIENSDTTSEHVSPAPAPRPPRHRRQPPERVEISIPGYKVAPTGAGFYGVAAAHPGFGAKSDAILPVASLSERRDAALLDSTLLLFSYGGMLALFWALGGRLGFNKMDVMVTVVTLTLFYAQYFTLFTVFGGYTPGMMVRGLRVVSFDGNVPTSHQMMWRSFGYLVAAGTCFLGFLWALWDEDHLCWQDRISQTYLTPIKNLAVDVSQSAAHRPGVSR